MGGTTDPIDAAGNVVESVFQTLELAGGRPYNDVKKWHFDAAGRVAKWQQTGPWGSHTNYEVTTHDGDGRPVKTNEVTLANGIITWYYIYSSVTGKKITDMAVGDHAATNVYLGASCGATARRRTTVASRKPAPSFRTRKSRRSRHEPSGDQWGQKAS